MSVVAVLLLMVLSCFGFGLALIRPLGLEGRLSSHEYLVSAWILGFGALGWVIFFPGIAGFANAPAMAVVLGLGVALGLPFYKSAWRHWRTVRSGDGHVSSWTWLLLVVLATVLAWDIPEALAPPTDADSLAYHYTLPKEFLQNGLIEFVPRAAEGGVPLLIQMTYMPPLALGGEQAMTLWSMLTGWALIWATYVFARRYLSVDWALATALLVYTTPAVTAGAGNGQIEVRNALFVIVGVLGLIGARQEDDAGVRARFGALAGLAAGFFLGAKYTGLFFAAPIGLMVFLRRANIRATVVCAATMLAAGLPWYVWNTIHIGDPMWPALYNLLGVSDPTLWGPEQHWRIMNEIDGDTPLPQNLWTMLTYPFVVTFWPWPSMEADRTGFGPFGMLMMPLVLSALAVKRTRLKDSQLAQVVIWLLFVYLLWTLLGPSQRVRHLVPYFPTLIVVVTAAGLFFASRIRAEKAVVFAALLTLGVHGGVSLLYGLRFVEYQVSKMDRETYLLTYLSGYEAVQWANAHIGQNERLMLTERQLLYYLDVPYFYAHPHHQRRIDFYPLEGRDVARSMFHDFQREKLTHFVFRLAELNPTSKTTSIDWINEMWAGDCVDLISTMKPRLSGSATLQKRSVAPDLLAVYKIRKLDVCR